MRGLTLLLAVAACSKGPSAAECRAEAEAFGRLLRDADVEASPFETRGIELVARHDLPRRRLDDGAPTLTVGRKLRLDASELQRDQLPHKLGIARDARELYHERSRPDPRRIYLLFDHATPWRDVVELVAIAASQNYDAPAFVFRAPTTVQRPPRTALDDQLDALLDKNASDLATEIARLMGQLVEKCPSMVRQFGHVASEGGDRARFLVEQIPQALIDCGCDVPMPDFKVAIWRVLVNDQPTRAILTDPSAPVRRLALPATTPWSEASKQLPTTPARLELAVQ
jgi:hypothetical protein